jgi:hypothetical protein
MAFLAGTTLVWPGTALDHAWALNSRAHRELAPLGWMIGIPFLLLGASSSPLCSSPISCFLASELFFAKEIPREAWK